MQGAIDALDGGGKGSEIHDDLKMPLANALSDYVDDTHQILSDHVASGNGGVREENGAGHLDGGADSLVRVLRGVSDEPEAYALLYSSERARTAELIAELPTDPHADRSVVDTPAQRIGTALGAYDGIRADVILDNKDDRMEWADKTSSFASTVNGTVTGFIPEVGDIAGGIVDLGLEEWADGVKKEAQDAGNKDASDQHFAALRDGKEMALGWGRLTGDTNNTRADLVYSNIALGHTTGHANAWSALGRNGQQ